MLFDAVTPVAVTSSTDATPIVITATSHGLTTGDQVQIFGHTTNVAANGIWSVTVVTANTFSLQNVNTGANVAGSGAGAGASGVLVKNPKIALVEEFRNAILQVGTTGTATLTLKVAGSLAKSDGSNPNFGGTVSPANPYTYVQVINLDTGAAVNGATGLVASGADINNSYEININALKYLNVHVSSWTQGVISVKLLLTTPF